MFRSSPADERYRFQIFMSYTVFFLGVFRPLFFDEIMYLSKQLLLFVGRFNDLFVFVNVFSVNVLVFIIGIIKLTVTMPFRAV